MKSELEERALMEIKIGGHTTPEREYRFHEIRKWRFDFAYPKQKIAIEIEGGIWNRGRHSRGVGIIGDCEKYNEAVIMGWRILRYTTNTIKNIPGDLWRILNDKA